MNRHVWVVIYITLLILALVISASANTLEYASIGPDVRSLQLRLTELEYLTADISGEFDMPTQAAVDTFRRQNGIPIADGIDEATWQTLFSPDAVLKHNTTETPQLVPGSTGEAVTSLQVRLLELGFYQEEFTAGVYDAATQYAQDRFCMQNGITTQSGATSALQSIILSNGAKGFEEGVNINAATKRTLKDSLLMPINLIGFMMPVVILYGVGIMALSLCVLLIVIAVRKNKKAVKVTSNAVKAMPENVQHTVQLTVAYGKHSHTQRYDIFELLPIGRGSSGVLLDVKDAGASRQHCDLFYRGSVLLLRDHSQCGTYVNGNLVHNDEVSIHDGDKIRISQHTIDVAM